MKLTIKLIILLSLTCVSICSHEAMKTFIQKCTSKCNKQYCNIRSVCRPINRTSKLISVDLYINPGVTVEAPICIELNAYKKFTTVYRPFMIKAKDELCHQLMQKDHIFYKLAGPIINMGNLLDPCPLSGHRSASPRYSSDETFLFPLIPIGEWKFEIILTKTKNGSDEFLGQWAIYYEIKPTGAEQF